MQHRTPAPAASRVAAVLLAVFALAPDSLGLEPTRGYWGPPIHNMGFCSLSRLGESPNTWKHFGPAPTQVLNSVISDLLRQETATWGGLDLGSAGVYATLLAHAEGALYGTELGSVTLKRIGFFCFPIKHSTHTRLWAHMPWPPQSRQWRLMRLCSQMPTPPQSLQVKRDPQSLQVPPQSLQVLFCPCS